MVVDSGAGLITTSAYFLVVLDSPYLPTAIVNTSNGDITSLTYNGKQLQDSSKFTHLSSGLGTLRLVLNIGESLLTCAYI